MKIDPKVALESCETLMLDMDGTILDLAFDNFMWLHHVPERYAADNNIELDEARTRLYSKFREMQGQLEWYCLDHWSDFLGLDIAGLHREQNHRIDYLPGAKGFLRAVQEYDIRILMVTNSHKDTLEIKDEVTGVTEHFDGIYSSHTFGVPKESQKFWEALQQKEGFDPATTLFIDDTAHVLDSAHEYGVSMLVEITHPDTSEPEREIGKYPSVKGLRELL
ncbi:MAG: GMP/IMP nucleotidase [Gammaproteobacteria bacterium]|nr:GMP/IMP nucleotidase [Gammaproteobacteria bacterium]